MDQPEKKETSQATSSNLCVVDNVIDAQVETSFKLSDTTIEPQSTHQSPELNVVNVETQNVKLDPDKLSTNIKEISSDAVSIMDNSPSETSDQRYDATVVGEESNLLELENMAIGTSSNGEVSSDPNTSEGK